MTEKDIEALKNGDESAFVRIAEDFSPLIKSEVAKAASMASGYEYDFDELTQEAMLALYKAACSYNTGGDVTFGLYAKICIKNRMLSCIRKLASRARRAERIRSSVPETHHSAPEELLLAIEDNSEFGRWLSSALTKFEASVLNLYLEKKRYSEIASELGVAEKSVDNALYRVKRKIREKLSHSAN